jgi:hypothetical protein
MCLRDSLSRTKLERSRSMASKKACAAIATCGLLRLEAEPGGERLDGELGITRRGATFDELHVQQAEPDAQ